MYIHLHTPTCCGMLSSPADGEYPELLSGCPDVPSRMHRCNEPLWSEWEMHTYPLHTLVVYTPCSRIYLLTRGVVYVHLHTTSTPM